MVNVIGLGYIGLPTALMMASHGVDVTGTDLSLIHISIWQTRQRTVTAESTFRLVNAAIMRTRTLRRASHGMNAAASGMSLPLLLSLIHI